MGPMAIAAPIRAAFVKQLDEIVQEYESLGDPNPIPHNPDKPWDGVKVKPAAAWVQFNERSLAAIDRIAPASSYQSTGRDLAKLRSSSVGESWIADRLLGVLRALRADLTAGYLESSGELIRGDLFGDFLEMARHLAEEHYKDPAAVIAGSALEAHLRQLCGKAGIDIELQTANGPRPKKADALNSELAKAKAYSGGDQKSVTAWLATRNSAAHGQYGDYTLDQVRLLIDGIRDFIARHPA